MNKKFLGIFVFMLAAVMLATPVMADPTKGQKVPIELWWTMTGTDVETRVTGGVVHRIGLVYWDVVLELH